MIAFPMRIIARSALRKFWRIHPASEQPLKVWFRDAAAADWRTPQDIKNVYPSASFIGDNRVVFNIRGNRFRLIVKFNYPYRIAYVRFIGTHAEYDRIDAETI